VAACPGSLIVHLDGTVLAWTQDLERLSANDVRRPGDDARHEGRRFDVFDWTFERLRLLRRPVATDACIRSGFCECAERRDYSARAWRATRIRVGHYYESAKRLPGPGRNEQPQPGSREKR
jgi:hypothetical protein